MKKILAIVLIVFVVLGSVFAGAVTEKTSTSLEITLLNSKPEITEALENAAIGYKAQTGVSIVVFETDAPGDFLTKAYAAGDPTTLAIVDYANVKDFSGDYFLEFLNEKWIADGGKSSGAIFDGKLYGFPFAVEARGVIYNKTIIEKLLGKPFNPTDYSSRSAFASLLEQLRIRGMENAMVLNSADWSIGSHFLQTMYSLYDGSMAGGYEFIDDLKKGSLNIANADAFKEAFDTLDLFKEYNYNKKDPLAADYDMNAAYCADGTVAFWLNGSFAWPDFAPFAVDGYEYGIMALPVSEKSPAFGNISAAATKYIVIDKSKASADKQKAALDFLDWLVYSKEGNDLLVNKLGVVPAFSNINLPMSNPFNVDLQKYVAHDNVICAFTDVPADHRSALGGYMQQYLANIISRSDLAKVINAYWISRD